jgi:hypothetical protein
MGRIEFQAHILSLRAGWECSLTGHEYLFLWLERRNIEGERE